MLITRKSIYSGIVRTMDLNMTEKECSNYLDGYNVQDAFPNLTADEREFILTGITAEEWDDLFSDVKEE